MKATEARKAADKFNLEDIQGGYEKAMTAIKHASANGKYEATVYMRLRKEVQDKLVSDGYYIDRHDAVDQRDSDSVKITW